MFSFGRKKTKADFTHFVYDGKEGMNGSDLERWEAREGGVKLSIGCCNSDIKTMTYKSKIRIVRKWACYEATNLISIDLPKGIAIIGHGSFHGCISLKDTKFPKSLIYIGKESFRGCSSLEKVDLLQL